ncbi:MAG: hypothetical protein Q8Q17_03140 [bacterium]|nr:hypothetical protein [bacterium]
MTNKGNGGFIPIIFLIVGLAVAVLLSLFWVRSLQLACVQNGTCIILPFVNNGGFYATSTEALIPEIPRPVIGSVPEVSVVDCRYYNIDSILFDWEMPEGVDGVEYGMSENPDYEFSKTSRGIISRAEYDLNLFNEGTLYFSARFKQDKNWGPAAVKYFHLDRTPPEPFRIGREDNNPANEQPVFKWAAKDKTSGIAHYQIKIGEGDWFDANTIKEGESYVFPEQSPAYSRKLVVRAYDFAGNFRDSFANFQVIPKTGWRSFLYRWPLFLIVIAIIAVALLPFLLVYKLIKWRNRFSRKIRRDFKVVEKLTEDIKNEEKN